MDKQKAMDYILNSPQNTNPSVLSSVLDSLTISDNKEEIELSATENKVYTPDNGKVYKKVTVNVPAPVSDFSTAEVTITLPAGYLETGFYWTLPIIISNKVVADSYKQEELTETHPVVLYKGVCEAYLGVTTAISGSATIDENNVVTVTGDCSFTMSE